jgi:hypothetical protein
MANFAAQPERIQMKIDWAKRCATDQPKFARWRSRSDDKMGGDGSNLSAQESRRTKPSAWESRKAEPFACAWAWIAGVILERDRSFLSHALSPD